MRELFNFFARNSKWLVFVVLVVLSCMMLFTRNPYQHHVYLTSAGQVTGTIYGVAGQVTSYFNLHANNEDLNERNAALQAEVIDLREQMRRILQQRTPGDTTQVLPFAPLRHYDFITAHVINNSVMRPNNYVTIDKGSADGVKPEMGVIDQNGVVGIVNVVSDHHARLISLLNPHFRLSCKIKGNESFGSLVWDGKDPRVAILEELPRHTKFRLGDTVVTSGYSAVFPEGIPVGYVLDTREQAAHNFFTIRVRLLSDFCKLNNVQVVVNNHADELRRLDEANKLTEGKDDAEM